MPQPRVLAVMLRSMARQTSAREGCCSTGAGGTLRALSACVPAPTARGLVCCQSRGRSCAVRRRTCSRAAPSSRAQRGGGRMNGHTAQHPGRAMSARARRPPALRRVQLAARSPALPASPSASSLAAGRAGHWPPLPRTTSTSRSSAAVGRQSAASRACLTCLTTGHRPLTTASDHLLPACCPPGHPKACLRAARTSARARLRCACGRHSRPPRPLARRRNTAYHLSALRSVLPAATTLARPSATVLCSSWCSRSLRPLACLPACLPARVHGCSQRPQRVGTCLDTPPLPPPSCTRAAHQHSPAARSVIIPLRTRKACLHQARSCPLSRRPSRGHRTAKTLHLLARRLHLPARACRLSSVAPSSTYLLACKYFYAWPSPRLRRGWLSL